MVVRRKLTCHPGWATAFVAALILTACGSDAAELGHSSGPGNSDASTQSDASTDQPNSSDTAADPAAADRPDEPTNESDGGGPGSIDDLPIDPGELPEPDGLEPSQSAIPPPGWLLSLARAEVSVPSGTFGFGGERSLCSAIGSAEQVIFSSNFQRAAVKNMGPYFGYTDASNGTVIWALYIGQGGEQGEEWSGGTGSPTITGYEGEFSLISPGGIVFDPAAEGIESDGRAFLISADWSGEASENFTSERGPSSVSVRCLFVEDDAFDFLNE